MSILLTPEGLNLLERHVLEAFIQNPQEIQKAAKALDLNLTPIIKKYLKRFFEMEEDLLRLRSGEMPRHRNLDYSLNLISPLILSEYLPQSP